MQGSKQMNKEYIKLNIGDIQPYANNPRLNDGAVAAVKESIKQCGYVAPIIIDEDNVILAGHTRYKALKSLKRKEIDVLRITGLTDEQKRKYRLLDNKTNEFADWDFNLLDAELEGLDFDGFDFGFDVNDVSQDAFGTDFTLPDGEKPEICQMTFTLHSEQKALIEYAIRQVSDQIQETFGNTNKNGNALYEVIRQWAERKK